jgi:hypothetical protein
MSEREVFTIFTLQGIQFKEDEMGVHVERIIEKYIYIYINTF